MKSKNLKYKDPDHPKQPARKKPRVAPPYRDPFKAHDLEDNPQILNPQEQKLVDDFNKYDAIDRARPEGSNFITRGFNAFVNDQNKRAAANRAEDALIKRWNLQRHARYYRYMKRINAMNKKEKTMFDAMDPAQQHEHLKNKKRNPRAKASAPKE